MKRWLLYSNRAVVMLACSQPYHQATDQSRRGCTASPRSYILLVSACCDKPFLSARVAWMERSEIQESVFSPDSARCAVGTTQQGASLLHLGYVVALDIISCCNLQAMTRLS